MRKLFRLVAVLVVFATPVHLNTSVGGALPNMDRYDDSDNSSDDYCAQGTFHDTATVVVCVDDYPCELIVKLRDIGSWQCSHQWEFGRHF